MKNSLHTFNEIIVLVGGYGIACLYRLYKALKKVKKRDFWIYLTKMGNGAATWVK